MARKPTSREIDAAKEFVRRRVDIQRHVEYELNSLFEEAAENIALIVAKYKARGMKLRFTGSSAMAIEIENVLNRLRDDIDYYVFLYCAPDEASDDEAKAIAGYVKGEFYGSTYGQREALYISNYRKALSGIAFDGMELDEEEMVSAIADETEKSKHRLLLLAMTTVAYGWMKYLLNTSADGKTGFWVVPGSSHPCEFCVEMQKRFHPIEEFTGIYHPNCCCIFVFV